MTNSDRITVISGTDRPDSNSMRVARTCAEQLNGAAVLDLRDIRTQWLADSSYGRNTPEFNVLMEEYIRGVERFVFVVPEYNGSFPGILKYFIDACDHGEWADKKIALVGITTGRSGNLRGLDHLTGIFHYLKSEVLSRKVYISQVNHRFDGHGNLADELTLTELKQMTEAFLKF